MIPAFPKPSQIKKAPEAVRVFRDGREQCNLLCKAGMDEYLRRKRVAWEEQGRTCSIGGEPLRWADSTVDHKSPRGMGGGSRDDRQENIGAACGLHNAQKGSRRITFIDAP